MRARADPALDGRITIGMRWRRATLVQDGRCARTHPWVESSQGDLSMHAVPGHPTVPATAPVRTRPLRIDANTDAPPLPHSVSGAPDVVLVKSGFKQVAIHIHEITFAEAARNYVLVHLVSGAVIKSRVPIERLAEHLGTARFLRIHRGRLVNVERIRAVTPLTGGRLRLALLDGATILVARDRRRAVLAELAALTARGA